jgi:hypothetical protein
MKGTTITILTVVVIILAVTLLYDFEVTSSGELPETDVDVTADSGNLPEYEMRKTEEGELPDVDVSGDVSGGQMPEVDVESPDVEVGTNEKTVTYPDVDVSVDEEQDEVTVPTVDVDLPDNDGNVEAMEAAERERMRNRAQN